MAITSKKTVSKTSKGTSSAAKTKGRMLTKKQKAHKRVAYIKKVIESKKRAKIKSKKLNPTTKRRQYLQAQNEEIQLVAPQDNLHQSNQFAQDAQNRQEQMNILSILGLTQGSEQNNSSESWQKRLEEKLKEVNSKSLDNPEVRRVYGEIGKIFGTYRSGKVPKAFKVIPNLVKWREVLELTHPQKWTPQAMYQAVNIFASNFDPIRAEEFYRHYLVPAVKKDLEKNKKLNYHYYESLKKGLYKTNAWFKGILFEFCPRGTNLKQIHVIESILTKMSIPVISSSVALIKMTQMPASTAVTHYLKALVCKNYSFPKKVLVTLVSYLLKFAQLEEQLPVIWQQLFLTIVKQYGGNIDEMSKASLVGLANKKSHKLITPEILKELS